MAIQSAFEPDPDLEPIKPPSAAEVQQPVAAARPVSPGPVVQPADPAQWSRTVPLAFPVTVDGELLTAITLRRVTGKQVTDLLMQDDEQHSLNRRARGLVAGVHPDVLDGLESEDLLNVLEAARPFLPRALQGADLLELAADVLALGNAAEPA